jgi:hypothetical protein
LHKDEVYREELEALRAIVDSVLAGATYVSSPDSAR